MAKTLTPNRQPAAASKPPAKSPAPPAATAAVTPTPAVPKPPTMNQRVGQPVVNAIDVLWDMIKRAVNLLAQNQESYCPGMSQDVDVHRVIGTVGLIKKLLEFNTDNRPKNPGTVKNYTNKMLNGQWAWDLPVVVMLDTDGKVHNGQHVMSALLDAEKQREASDTYRQSCENQGFLGELCLPNMLIVTGLDPSTADHIDTGRARKQSDILFRKYKDYLKSNDRKPGQIQSMSNMIATVSKFVWLRLVHGSKQRTSVKFGHEDLIDFMAKHEGIVKSCEMVFDEDKASKSVDGVTALHKKCSLHQLAMVHYLMCNMNPEDVPGTDLENGVDERQIKADQFIKEFAAAKLVDKLDKATIPQILLAWITKHRGTKTGGLNNTELETQCDAILVAAHAFATGASYKASELMSELTVPRQQPSYFVLTDGTQVEKLSRGDNVEGYKQGKVYFFPDNDGNWQQTDEKEAKKAGWEITPVLESTYPCLGGLDVKPVQWDEEEDLEVEEEATEQPAEDVPEGAVSDA